MTAVYENDGVKCEAENEKRDSNYEELEQREEHTDQDNPYTELKYVFGRKMNKDTVYIILIININLICT